ncbi:transcription factor TFIIIB component B'' homolog [Lytechinus pictus]|uniref:transcription factor TFIIIB component B'' homolog n=1 Tax=Lytechinus pictus TaxID=7653 RepID=UPI0030B9CA4E
MRRSKIKPSINLASRRSVSTPSHSKDKGNIGAPVTSNTTQGKDAVPKPSQKSADEPPKPSRERSASQSERTDADSKKETPRLNPEVTQEPLPLKDTTKQQDGTTLPASAPEDKDEQSCGATIPSSASSAPAPAQDAGTKMGPPSIRRKRFSAVPNLGQPRLRPTGQRSQVTPAGPPPETSSRQEQKENEEAVKRPPPVQRVLSVHTANDKKVGSASPLITSVVPDVQKNAVTKSHEPVPLQKAPIAPSGVAAKVVTTKAPEVQASGDSKSSEVEGKKSAHHSNVYSKKLKELKDQMDEETPSNRRKRHARSTSPDRATMTMGDLIYYNPRTNPMKVSEAEKKNKKSKTENNQKKKVTFGTDEEQEEAVEEDASSATMAPQVKIGPDGEIIIDQTSLYVQASPVQTFDPSESEIVHEDASTTTYSSFRKHKRTSAWTQRDTERFYFALSAVGTDFATITAMFPSRTRAEIKRKFKREERTNRGRVDGALMNRKELKESLFDLPSDESDVESAVDANKNKKKKPAKRNEKKVASKENAQVALDDIAEEPEDQNLVVDDASRNGDLDSQDDTEDQPNLENILSITRSGRQPKLRTSFTIQIPPKVNRKRTRASPSQKANDLKVFDDYAKHRIQRLQSEHEATLSLKRLARNEAAQDQEEESDDGRSDMTMDMMSEVGSEVPDDLESVDNLGLTNNLQPLRVLQRNSPSVGLSSFQLGDGGFSSPESINDPSVKKVTLMITTPDGKQTLVQVNLTSGESNPLPVSSGSSQQAESGAARLRDSGVGQPSPKAGSAQIPAGATSQATSNLEPSPARTLTALTDVSSPYQRASPHNKPSKQSKNVTILRIIDGKVVRSPSQPSTSTTSPGMERISPAITPSVKSIPSMQLATSSTHSLHQQSSVLSLSPFPSGVPEGTSVIATKETSPIEAQKSVEVTPAEAPIIPVVTENVCSDNLLSIGSLHDLDMSMTFDPSIGIAAYEESIETNGDNIVAQQVNIASTNPDEPNPQAKPRYKRSEPFIPPIK